MFSVHLLKREKKMSMKNTDRMNELLRAKREASLKNGRRGGVRFLGWGFKDLTNAAVAKDFCAVEQARTSGILKPQLVSSFGF